MDITKLQIGKRVIFGSVPYLSFLREGLEYEVQLVTDENIYFMHITTQRVTFEDVNDLKQCHAKILEKITT